MEQKKSKWTIKLLFHVLQQFLICLVLEVFWHAWKILWSYRAAACIHTYLVLAGLYTRWGSQEYNNKRSQNTPPTFLQFKEIIDPYRLLLGCFTWKKIQSRPILIIMWLSIFILARKSPTTELVKVRIFISFFI